MVVYTSVIVIGEHPAYPADEVARLVVVGTGRRGGAVRVEDWVRVVVEP